MEFIQEFDSRGWKPMHRLVIITDDGRRVEGPQTLTDMMAIISDEAIRGEPEPTQVRSGYIVTTDYWGGEIPRLMRFEDVGNVSFKRIDADTNQLIPIGEDEAIDECAELDCNECRTREG
jgi:hypothetical protein